MFKPVFGYEDLYEVNEEGLIKSFHNGIHDLKSSKNPNGYQMVVLCKDGQRETKAVHRIVAEAFLERVEGLTQVNHIDGNKDNNSLTNLEWCTKSQNTIHAYANGLHPQKGLSHTKSKFNEMDLIKIKTLKDSGKSYLEIALELNVNRSTIVRFLRGKTYGNIPSDAGST